MEISLPKNDRKARIIILTFSVIIFIAVTALERVTLNVSLGFDVHIFALMNAVINSIVAVLLVAGLLAAKKGNYITHRNIMLTAMALSVIFLVSYVLHHLFAGSTYYGDLDRNGVVSEMEKAEAGSMRYVYFFLLGTHILLAGVSLPYILFTAYRALISENARHRKIARVTWPMWFYVAISGPLVYYMISQYY
jgi:putative membrane protein